MIFGWWIVPFVATRGSFLIAGEFCCRLRPFLIALRFAVADAYRLIIGPICSIYFSVGGVQFGIVLCNIFI